MTLDELIKERDRINNEIKRLRTREIVSGRTKFRVKNENRYQICFLRNSIDKPHMFTTIIESTDSQNAIRQAKSLIKDLETLISEVQKIDLLDTNSL